VSVFSDTPWHDKKARRKKWIGIGYFNPKSEISIRLLTRLETNIDRNFFLDRIQKAMHWRKTHLNQTNALRWINSESDGLPGLILDEYNGYFVLQISTLGMEVQKNLIVEIIKDLFHPKGLYERNDIPTRSFEGLPLSKGRLDGENLPELIEIQEGKTRFYIDIVNGHKSGFYLDQRDNRMLTAKLSEGREVLDCFSYTGGFAISCLTHGAKNALAVEVSQEALDIARKNALLNQVQDRWQDHLGNGFDLLKSLSSEGRKFDLIILDPPSFTRKKERVEQALAGYKEINLRAIKMLREGGTLVSASCSHHIQENLFEEVILQAASDNKRVLYLIYRGTQGLDHPIIPSIPETQYLKCFFFEARHLS
jgi:23S rRNA (cytosine1962-C5)-methyltransferase